MGNSATRAKNKYNGANYDRISLSVPKGQKDELKTFVEDCGYASINQFVIDAIEYYKNVVHDIAK